MKRGTEKKVSMVAQIVNTGDGIPHCLSILLSELYLVECAEGTSVMGIRWWRGMSSGNAEMKG